MTTIGTADVRAFVARRQAEGAANGSINRDLTILKRMFTLAVQGGKLMMRPYIPLLKENNVRKGFFEPEQFKSVKNHLAGPHAAHRGVRHTSRAGARRARSSRSNGGRWT